MKYYLLCCIVTIMLSVSGRDAGAVELLPEDHLVKTALVYNIAKYVEWPAESFGGESSPLVICTIGRGRFTGNLASLNSKPVRNHPVQVRALNGTTDSSYCHIIAFGDLEQSQIIAVLDKRKRSSVLTVSDYPGFARMGGVVGFYQPGNRIRFEINLASGQQQRLRFSSQLLKLARIVREDEQ